ncbi:hypothetical protein AK812_SmicGene32732 [Symbiodinium microadriaticum]|uniref:Uncharacterized protein n=1 Tax=Symbiodinium microadriaticum TaxID=2951 RepID=A0A1Q9CTG2_SYMMI|nr:hypothetical protein AK812_SmicGene32732 [Symbiodinium microadriaticum]
MFAWAKAGRIDSMVALEAVCKHFGNDVHPESEWIYMHQAPTGSPSHDVNYLADGQLGRIGETKLRDDLMTRRFACLTHALAGKHFTKAGGRGTNNPLVFDRLCKGSLVPRGMGGRLPGGSAWQRLQQASQPPPSPESFFRSLATCVPDKARFVHHQPLLWKTFRMNDEVMMAQESSAFSKRPEVPHMPVADRPWSAGDVLVPVGSSATPVPHEGGEDEGREFQPSEGLSCFGEGGSEPAKAFHTKDNCIYADECSNSRTFQMSGIEVGINEKRAVKEAKSKASYAASREPLVTPRDVPGGEESKAKSDEQVKAKQKSDMPHKASFPSSDSIGVVRRLSGQEDILNDVDSISSAECTPEVGQCFRSNSSMKVLRTSVPMLPETKVRLKPKSNQSARKLAVPTFLYIVSINAQVLLAAQEHQQATQSFSESEATVASEAVAHGTAGPKLRAHLAATSRARKATASKVSKLIFA